MHESVWICGPLLTRTNDPLFSYMIIIDLGKEISSNVAYAFHDDKAICSLPG